jgi:UDP-N-acetylmuramoyl-L-alanyl-D-glutamate--2,6-diaminopimelate ligase
MRLGDLLGVDAPAVEIAALAYDNRLVRPGTLFFCVPGFTRDGHDFAPDAVARGAAALVVERPLDLGVPEVRVESVRAAMAPAAARFYGDPSSALTMVGVTGTSGKTTTSFLVRALLEAAGIRTGMLGTVTSVVGGEERPVRHTTPEAIDLQCTLREMLDGGDRACAMEVSSHALELGRADAIDWDVAVFTNLSQDHLDFHPSMDAYFAAKRRLFAAGPRVSVVNADDEHGRRLARELDGVVTYGLDAPDADVRATDVEIGFTGSRFRLGDLTLSTPLVGAFNVSNCVAAVAVARALGVDDATIADALPRIGRVPGRFEAVDEGQRFAVVVDYAHKPDALEKLLRAARELASGRVIIVFGAGGDRDRAKRPIMGAIAERLADAVVVTSDNPRSEAPEAIIGAILDGMQGEPEWHVDRREAIAAAIEQARPGDVVLIAGKGHEQGQELAGGHKVPFDDVTVAREALRGARLAG